VRQASPTPSETSRPFWVAIGLRTDNEARIHDLVSKKGAHANSQASIAAPNCREVIRAIFGNLGEERTDRDGVIKLEKCDLCTAAPRNRSAGSTTSGSFGEP
jgi:hypothetical protein